MGAAEMCVVEEWRSSVHCLFNRDKSDKLPCSCCGEEDVAPLLPETERDRKVTQTSLMYIINKHQNKTVWEINRSYVVDGIMQINKLSYSLCEKMKIARFPPKRVADFNQI